MGNSLITERNSLPPAHPGVWLGGQYISISDLSREQFLSIMSAGLSDDLDLGQLASAYTIAKTSFLGENGPIKRTTGERYFDHVKAVSFIGTIELGDPSPERAIARLFHDNHEDTRIGAEHIRLLFGKKVADLVRLVSNPPKTGNTALDLRRKKSGYLALQQFPDAGKIKISDRIHNNRSQELVLMMQKVIPLDKLTQDMLDWGSKKAEETREFIYPIGQSLGGKYLEGLDISQQNFEKAIIELKDSVGK